MKKQIVILTFFFTLFCSDTNDQWVQMYPEKNFILPNGIQGFDAVLSKDGKTAAAAVFNQESNATDTAYVRVFEL